MPDRPRILCVDDEKLNRAIVRDTLDPEKFLVIEAENGEEALNILEDHVVDIILLDVNMPGIDGFEVCRRIKASDKLRHIPVIMITALADTEDRIRGIEAGAEELLSSLVPQMASSVHRARLDREARFDALTGVPVRRILESRLQQAYSACCEHGWSMAVIMCDIDHFKKVNDTYGHAAGDEALKVFAQTLETHRRENDRLVGLVDRKGYTLVALTAYWSRGRAKMKLGIARGKKAHDKRATIKERDWKRDQARMLKGS